MIMGQVDSTALLGRKRYSRTVRNVDMDITGFEFMDFVCMLFDRLMYARTFMTFCSTSCKDSSLITARLVDEFA